jgi:hypothetical protein
MSAIDELFDIKPLRPEDEKDAGYVFATWEDRPTVEDVRKAAAELAKLKSDFDDTSHELTRQENENLRLRAELAQLRADLEYIVEQNKIFLDGMNQLRAELDEWDNAKKFVADGCTDEIHCGCVPILKRVLAASQKAVDEAREVMQPIVDEIPEETFPGDEMTIWTRMAIELEVWLSAHPAQKFCLCPADCPIHGDVPDDPAKEGGE